MSHQRTIALAFLAVCSCCSFLGCSTADPPAKTSFTEQDRQQVQELNQQRMDEWGRKVK